MEVHCATCLLFRYKYELRSIRRYESWQVIIVRHESLLTRAAHDEIVLRRAAHGGRERREQRRCQQANMNCAGADADAAARR